MALTTNLISYWKLDEASGNAVDSVGTNTLTNNNIVTYSAGKIGNAANFVTLNTTNLSIASNASLTTGDIDFSYAGWVNLGSTSTSQVFWGKVPAAGASRNGDMELLLTTGPQFYVRAFGSSDAVEATVTAADFGNLSTGTWYFVYMYHNATTNKIGISVNNGAANEANDVAIGAGTNPFTIGAWAEGVNGNLQGSVDALGFWKKLLDSEDLATLWSGGAGRQYPFTTPNNNFFMFMPN